MPEREGRAGAGVGAPKMARADRLTASDPVRPQGGARSRSLLLGLLLVCRSATALDLLDSYQAALAGDAEYLAAQAVRRAGVEAVPQARAQLLPNVSAGYARSRLETRSPAYVALPDQRLEYFSRNEALTLRQSLLRPALIAGYAQAQHLANAADATLDKATQGLAVRVAASYFDALLAIEQTQLVEAQRVSLGAVLKSARAALAKGVGTRTDIDEAQARFDQSTADLLAARQQMAYTRQALEVVIGQPVDRLAVLPAGTLARIPLALSDLAAWQARAAERNPDVRTLSAQLAAAQQQIEKSRAGHYPTVDLVVQRALSSGETVTNPLNRYNTTSAGLQLNIPLFAGGYQTSVVRQAQAERDRVAQQLEAAQRRVALEVRRAFQDIEEGALRVEALAEAAHSATTALRSTEKSRAAGFRTQLDVLDAEQRLVNARRDLAEARLACLLAHVRLASLADDAGEEQLRQINALLGYP